jgi:D-alanine-D-alanine ligase
LVSPREIEIAILGNKELTISEPGELILAKDFYDYNEKYINNQSTVHIPAKLSAKDKKYIINLAQKTYKLCDCSGFARIDFFIANNNIYLNEINTLPGFTDISMFPMLMMHQGMTYKKLINTIISLAY